MIELWLRSCKWQNPFSIQATTPTWLIIRKLDNEISSIGINFSYQKDEIKIDLHKSSHFFQYTEDSAWNQDSGTRVAPTRLVPSERRLSTGWYWGGCSRCYAVIICTEYRIHTATPQIGRIHLIFFYSHAWPFKPQSPHNTTQAHIDRHMLIQVFPTPYYHLKGFSFLVTQ